MELQPLGVNRNNAMGTTATSISHYPIAYFLCDRLTDAKVLKDVLGLEKRPKLRKARIEGYRRLDDTTESSVAYDGRNFGERVAEETVDGVVFEALNSEQEQKLMKYIGGDGEVKSVKMEVACPSILGKVGKTTTIIGRILVQAGEGDTLVGSIASRPSGDGSAFGRQPEYVDDVVSNGNSTRATTAQGEIGGEDDPFETSSVTTEVEQPTPRISPTTSTIRKAETSHESLDALPLSAFEERVSWQDEVNFGLENAVAKPVNIESQVEKVEDVGDKDNRSNHDSVNQNGEDVALAETADRGTLKVTNPTELSAGAGDEPWTPTIPWRKENAISPIRPTMPAGAESSFITKTKLRKTSNNISEGIKSIVEKFESLSPKAISKRDA